ncbi:hypothetical protein [Candidatus Palauibacter sp.]|uniref:hypothetical protein n=1 Tax=Candidatus Palauibacter sp. TaxID=3101350 RepID=UPI003B5B3FA9
MRGIGMGPLATYLVGISLAAGCGGPVEPEPPDVMDLDVPEFVLIDGLEVRARLDVTSAGPTPHVAVSVDARNRTNQAIEFTAGTPCFVRPVVYARGADAWIHYPGSPEVALGLFLCPQVVFLLTLPPGETLTLSRVPPFPLADWIGMEFRPDTYVVTATVAGRWAGGSHEVELLAGQVDAR